MVAIEHRHGLVPTTEDAIANAERTLGVVFPEDYRRFLLEHNGGTPVPDAFFIEDVDQYALVDCFFGLGRPSDDLLRYFSEIEDRIPEAHVPIGVDPGNNVLLMDLGPEGMARVYYWDDLSAFGQSTDEENTYLVAGSFTDFLSKLQPLPEGG